MKIPFAKKSLKYYLISGIFWAVFGIIMLISSLENNVYYAYLLLGAIPIGIYFFEKNNDYLTLENGILTKKFIVTKKIKLCEVREIIWLSHSYTLKTGNNKMRINIEMISKGSIVELNEVLEGLK